MLDDVADPNGGRRITFGSDKGYDTRDFVAVVRERRATPHVAQNQCGWRSVIARRTICRHDHAASILIRKWIEEVLGWVKCSACQGKTRFRGLPRVRFAFILTAAAYNVVRLPKLTG